MGSSPAKHRVLNSSVSPTFLNVFQHDSAFYHAAKEEVFPIFVQRNLHKDPT